MARSADRNPHGAAGDWYVDDRCINCAAARHVAPGLIIETAGMSVFDHQPATPEETHQAWLAAELCPTRSVGTASRQTPPPGLYPHEVARGVWLCGHNARSSFGAHSWLVGRPGGNLLVDSPRYTRALTGPIEAVGGLDAILLTHRDDVADADKWAAHFDARVFIHAADQAAAPYAANIIHAHDPTEIVPGVMAIPIPGHTAGSVAYLTEDRHLFTGDSLFWNNDDLAAFEYACWYSWDTQRASLSRLGGHRFEQVFAAHGSWSPPRSVDEMHRRLTRLVERM